MTVPALFAAPWEQRLVALTVLLSAILLGGAGLLVWVALTKVPSTAARILLLSSALVSLGFFLFGALLGPRGFAIRESDLLIQRWLGSIAIPLSSIQAVELLPPERLSGSMRTLGSGGFFGYYGRFRNRTLGDYRMYATRGDGYVLVRADRTYVLTPESPDRFIAMLDERRARR